MLLHTKPLHTLGLTFALWSIFGIYFVMWNNNDATAKPPLPSVQYENQNVSQTTASPPVTLCPQNVWPDDPEARDLLNTQRDIHEQLFYEKFSWCTGSFWNLDEDITEVKDSEIPVLITGSTFGGEDFVIEIYEVGTVDWTGAELSPEVRQFANDWSYNYRIYGTIVYGPIRNAATPGN